MVKKRVILGLLLVLCLWHAPLAAAQFSAYLKERVISSDDSVVFSLVLEGAETQTAPDISPLEQYFHIEGRRKSTNLTLINGQMQHQTRWHYQLIPKRAGNLTIPSITLVTNQGTLQTRPLHVQVSQGTRRSPSRRPEDMQPQIRIGGRMLKNAPYVGETVFYRVEIYRGPNITETLVDKPKAQGARVEMAKEHPSRYLQQNGERWLQTVLDYAVTPIIDGKVTILPAKVQGAHYIPSRTVRKYRDYFQNDPLGVFRQMLRGRGFSEDFQRETSKHTIDVRPIPARWSHPREGWLPLQHLDLRQRTDAEELKVGEPITREITVSMLGAFPEALPDLEARLQKQADSRLWQLYAGKPKTSFVYDERYQTIRGKYVQQFTYIPLQSGTQRLPALNLPWWDVEKEQERVSQLEGQSFDIMPDHNASTPTTTVESMSIYAAEPESWSLSDRLIVALFMVAGAAGLGSWFAHYFGYRLQIPLWKTPWGKMQVKQQHFRPAGLEEQMGDARNVAELARVVDHYFKKQFDLGSAMTFVERANALASALTVEETEELQSLCRRLQACAYGGGGDLTLSRWKKRFISIMQKAEKQWRPPKQASLHRLSLNP